MQEFGRFLAGISWPIHIAIWAAFVGVAWFVVRRFEKLRPYTGQILVLLAILWMGTMFFFLSYAFRRPVFGSDSTEAGTIPRVWFYALVPSVALALFPLFKGKGEADPKWGNMRLVGIVLVALVVSIGLFNYIGYYISSAIFIVTLMWLLGSRNKIELIAVPAGWVAFSYFIFARLLHVRLPIGRLFSGLF